MGNINSGPSSTLNLEQLGVNQLSDISDRRSMPFA